MSTPNSQKILLSSPTMHGEEQVYIQEAFDTNWIAPLGPNVDRFEEEVAAYLGDQVHTAALSSGTAAIHLAVKAAGVHDGDVVFCSDMTFSASVNPACYERAVPVFIDSEWDSWNMDPAALERAFDKYPGCKAVIAVNLYGTPAKLDEIAEICHRHGAVLIEDAAESLSATYRGKKAGTFGDLAVLSFNGNKIITTSGGGMLISHDPAVIEKAHFWSTQSRDPAPHYQHSEIGYNYRMSNVLAGIGRGQLPHVEEHRAIKKKIWETYRQALSDLPLQMNPILPGSEPNFWLSCLLLNEDASVTPTQIRETLAEHNAESRPIWKPMHLQPVFADADFITAGADCVDEAVFARGLCLPSDIKMTEAQQQSVIETIRSLF